MKNVDNLSSWSVLQLGKASKSNDPEIPTIAPEFNNLCFIQIYVLIHLCTHIQYDTLIGLCGHI